MSVFPAEVSLRTAAETVAVGFCETAGLSPPGRNRYNGVADREGSDVQETRCDRSPNPAGSG